MKSPLLLLAFSLSAKRFAMLAMFAFVAVVTVWLIHRHRRNLRTDLQARGLVSRHGRHRSGFNGKRNPTLSETGAGLPPVRTGPPPGPIGGINL